MGFLGFGKNKEGGFMDVIRCDLPEYLVWKWSPNPEGQTTRKENAIRYGSSLRVKDGEVAVFVYSQQNGTMQDFIVGPYDKKIETANFPILTSIVGTAFGGESPFQAEIYFINLSDNVQVKFAVPYFDVFDPRFLDFAVPMAVHGTITFNITDYRNFIKLNRLLTFDLYDFEQQIKAAVTKYVKSFVSNVPTSCGIPVMQIERKMVEISDMIQERLATDFIHHFGVTLKRLDISDIVIDKQSEGYIELRNITATQQARTIEAQTELNIKNLADTQAINAKNMEETLRIQREEAQRVQRLQTETNFIGAHALDQQTEVMRTGMESLGKMSGNINMGGGSDNEGLNPTGMMTGMMMGSALGTQLSNMMNQMGQNLNTQMQTPPPIPTVQYYVAIGGNQSGPFNQEQLRQLVISGGLTPDTLVWTNGMPTWVAAREIPALASLFTTTVTPPPIPTL